MDLYSCIECGHNQLQLGALNTVIAASFDVDLSEDIFDFLVLGHGNTKAIKQDQAAHHLGRAFLCQSTALQRCLFLVPSDFNKFFYFYIVGNGFAMGKQGA